MTRIKVPRWADAGACEVVTDRDVKHGTEWQWDKTLEIHVNSDDQDSKPELAAEVKSHVTGEAYGLGVPGTTVHASLIIEGDQKTVVNKQSEFWCELTFDMPVAIGLSDELWTLPFDNTQLRVRLRRVNRGNELWSSLNTTTLPTFTRIAVKASPAFTPDKTQHVAEVVLENVDHLLAATNQCLIQRQHRQGITLRANYYPRPHREPRPILTVTVPITGVVESTVPDATPLTQEVFDRVQKLKHDLVDYVLDSTQDESFDHRIVRTVHDFGFYCRQHPETLGMLHEEELRDLLLIVQKQLFSAEGEAIQNRGKTDLKVVNPDNRYQFVVEELKIWRGESSIKELLDQALDSHVTGQEKMVVAQIFSRNREFQRVVDTACDFVSQYPLVKAPLQRWIFDGSPEFPQPQATSSQATVSPSITDATMAASCPRPTQRTASVTAIRRPCGRSTEKLPSITKRPVGHRPATWFNSAQGARISGRLH